MKFLPAILEQKRDEVSRSKADRPLGRLMESDQYGRETRSIASALRTKGFGIIAEVKKASPSKGVLRRDFQPVEIARSYQAGGASALSVLTDEKFFQGSLSYLREIRQETDLPLLRKDFIVDSYQLHEAKAAGADAVLLIVAALSMSELLEFQAEAAAIGLETLVEVHTAGELEAASKAGALFIGINNRNLDTFETDIETSVRLAGELPAGSIGIGESAISTPADLDRLKDAGLTGALIGEALMRVSDPGRELAAMMRGMKS
jgi:indole-3-glycerol phosphate synthase